MTRVISVIVAVLFAFALTSASFADGTKATEKVADIDQDKDKDKKKKKAPSARKIREVSGVVTSVNATAQNMTVQGITVTADENVLSDIRVGDKVMVKYVTRGKHVAVLIIRQ